MGITSTDKNPSRNDGKERHHEEETCLRRGDLMQNIFLYFAEAYDKVETKFFIVIILIQ